MCLFTSREAIRGAFELQHLTRRTFLADHWSSRKCPPCQSCPCIRVCFVGDTCR